MAPAVLIPIAMCESHFAQYEGNGKDVLRGKVNPHDIGIMQINEIYHRANAEKLGYDIDTPDGNIAYGLWLYNHYGTAPWNASKKCWSKNLPDSS